MWSEVAAMGSSLDYRSEIRQRARLANDHRLHKLHVAEDVGNWFVFID